MKSVKKILLINFGGLGDEILFLPVVSSLRQKYPEAEITLCLEPRSKSIQNLCPDINKILTVDIKSKSKYFELLKFCFRAFCSHYDIVVSSGSNKMIPVLLFLTGARTKIGYDCGGFTKKLLTNAIALNKKQFAGRMYHDLVREYTGIEYNHPVINAEKNESAAGMIVIHPGVSKMSIRKNIIKSYGNAKWAELAEMLLARGEKVALAGGPDDDECICEILNYLKDKDCTNLYNFYGKTKNIKELASLLSGAKAVVCCDSAPMHLAVALNVKTIAIFGPTDEKKLVPDKDNVFVVKSDCNCRPCLWDKRMTSCKEKYCLNISNDKILEYLDIL